MAAQPSSSRLQTAPTTSLDGVQMPKIFLFDQTQTGRCRPEVPLTPGNLTPDTLF